MWANWAKLAFQSLLIFPFISNKTNEFANKKNTMDFYFSEKCSNRKYLCFLNSQIFSPIKNLENSFSECCRKIVRSTITSPEVNRERI
jgi:hypothetical protein